MRIFPSPITLHSSMASSSFNGDDFLLKEILLTHDPDDRCRLDSSLLLSLVEATLSLSCNAGNATILDEEVDFTRIDFSDSEEVEAVSRVIYRISHEILSCCFEGEKNLHKNTIKVLENLGRYRWDAKMVLALASFTHSFGIFWLILKLQSENELALSLATVKRIPTEITALQPKFKAMNLVVVTMLKLTRLLIKYESFSAKHELADDRDRAGARWRIYLAAYWICRSILVCSSQIADFRNLRLDYMMGLVFNEGNMTWHVRTMVDRTRDGLLHHTEFSDRSVAAAWGLYSLGHKLNSLCSDLGECIDKCEQQIETRLYERLQLMFKERAVDNQEALHALFAWEDEFPFNDSCSRHKIGIIELKSKIVLLLITRPNLLPLEKAFFLIHQTRISESHAVLWVPIAFPNEWSSADKTSFEFFSNRVPWLSIRRPWTLNSSIVKFITHEWGFREAPIIVVMNEHGYVTNTNGMDMVWIWGPKAFPFSSSREKELWEEADWTVDLMINGISPLFSVWVEQGKTLCIYGSDNIDWIRKLNEKIEKLRTKDIHLEAIYVGCKNPGENVRSIIHTIDQECLGSSMTFNGVDFFWFRLEILKRSVGQRLEIGRCNEIADRVGELLEMDSRDGWAIIGTGSSKDVIKLDQERLEAFWLWHKEMGLAGARGDGERCRHDEVVEYEEGLIEKTKICDSCNNPKEKFVYYKCEA